MHCRMSIGALLLGCIRHAPCKPARSKGRDDQRATLLTWRHGCRAQGLINARNKKLEALVNAAAGPAVPQPHAQTCALDRINLREEACRDGADEVRPPRPDCASLHGRCARLQRNTLSALCTACTLHACRHGRAQRRTAGRDPASPAHAAWAMLHSVLQQDALRDTTLG